MNTITTTKGDLPLKDLRYVEIEQDVPCGVCVTKQYWLGDDKVRQDIEIRVSPEALSMTSEVGQVGSAEDRLRELYGRDDV